MVDNSHSPTEFEQFSMNRVGAKERFSLGYGNNFAASEMSKWPPKRQDE